ncbi:hypothetical protein GCM10020366_15820 [Saccharopolyspora gregorii]|uniref:HEPN domain-containing protein n=1 Tax=Saccharopolyspora gregorii TaxID=33914 RepID=A0ABP6RMC2_9PSEU
MIVGRRALRARMRNFRETADRVERSCDDPETWHLLLFYGAECGLKERLLDRGGQPDTTDVPKDHDLRELAKRLGLPPVVLRDLGTLRARRVQQEKEPVALKDLHQAWRYGAKLVRDDEKRAEKALRNLIAWCEQGR